MSIFDGSERFYDEPAKSPGPIYGRVDIRAKSNVVMKEDAHTVDESRKWGKRDSWIGGISPTQMPVLNKDTHRAPGQYNINVEAVKAQAPKVSFPRSNRFLSQKVNVTDRGHARELMSSDSPGPKYNVTTLAANGGKAVAPGYSFASPTHGAKAQTLPSLDSSEQSHRKTLLSVINRNGVLIVPGADTPQSDPSSNSSTTDARVTKPTRVGSVFGSEHRFGLRQDGTQDGARIARSNGIGGQRVQFVSAKHSRENMGEFSPGPIYTPYNPPCPGGRLAPTSPRSPTRDFFPGSPREHKNTDTSSSSRSSWLVGQVRKTDGVETMLIRTGDGAPGPGSYGDPRSSFARTTHNVKAKNVVVKSARASPRSIPPIMEDVPRRAVTREVSLRAPEPTSINNG